MTRDQEKKPSETADETTERGSDVPADSADDREVAEHLPRAPFFSRISLADLFRIGMFATLLVAIILLRKPCADSVGRFFGNFEDQSDAGAGTAAHSSTDAGAPERSLEGYRLIPAAEAIDVLSDGGTIEDLE